MSAVAIVGAGRAGLGLGLALARAGHRVRVHGRRLKPVPLPLTLTIGEFPSWLSEVDILLVAVPDDAISQIATALAAARCVRSEQVVLHVSGALGREALLPLERTGAALGSLHPLQSLSDPLAAPDRLRGAVAAVEGDQRAVAAAEALARSVGLEPFEIAAARKPGYHAAAVFAANFLVTLAGVSQRLFVRAGLPENAATRALGALMAGTLENVRRTGPRAALTGPVARGDVETIRRHLAMLSGRDALLYRELARATLELTDLDAEKRQEIERALE